MMDPAIADSQGASLREYADVNDVLSTNTTDDQD